jgi:hypothetical protein
LERRRKIMTTEAQIQANRANAQQSTGPRTPEGKEKAAQNALKHGLFTRETVIRGEDEGEFAEYRENLLNQLIPGTPLEETLAERVVDLSWRLKRAARDQENAFVVLYGKHTAGAGEALEAQRDAAIGWMIVETSAGGGPGPAAAVRAADREQYVPGLDRAAAGARSGPEGAAGDAGDPGPMERGRLGGQKDAAASLLSAAGARPNDEHPGSRRGGGTNKPNSSDCGWRIVQNEPNW